jgi:hypothetical protein
MNKEIYLWLLDLLLLVSPVFNQRDFFVWSPFLNFPADFLTVSHTSHFKLHQ